MGAFLKNWETLKKDFATDVLTLLKSGGNDVPGEVRKAVVELVKTDTGFTPALKEVDAALAKRHRAEVMKALTAVHKVSEKNTKLMQHAAVHAMNAALEADGTDVGPSLKAIADCIKTFNTKVINIETDVAKALENLQEDKGQAGVKVDIISLEGDMKGAIDRFKKNISAYQAKFEKKLKSVELLDKLAKTMRAYSDAAARTQVKDARIALEKFFTQVAEVESYYKKVPKLKDNKVYVESLDKLCTALNAIKNTRGTASLKNLKALEAAGN